jgi:hypothetical protein
MNERLQNLAREAGYFEFNKWDYFDINKFAELIVRECSVALSPMLRDMISRGQAYDLIKEHFGVEE